MSPRVGCNDRAFGTVCPDESTPTTIADWGDIPKYKNALEKALGEGPHAGLKAETDALMPAFNRDARQLYTNFMRVLR